MQESWVWSLDQEDPLEKEVATHSSILSWRIPLGRGPWQATVHEVARVGHDLVTKLTHTSDHCLIALVVHWLSPVQLFVTTYTATRQASLSFTISWNLFKLMSTELVMSSNHPTLCCPLLFLASIFPSIRVFSNESDLHIRWLKYWSLSISPSNEYSGLISFRTDWLDLLAVQGTLKSLLQHYNSKASIFSAQLSLWS